MYEAQQVPIFAALHGGPGLGTFSGVNRSWSGYLALPTYATMLSRFISPVRSQSKAERNLRNMQENILRESKGKDPPPYSLVGAQSF